MITATRATRNTTLSDPRTKKMMLFAYHNILVAVKSEQAELVVVVIVSLYHRKKPILMPFVITA